MAFIPDIFGAQIAQIIADNLGPLVFDQVLIKVTTTRDPLNPTKSIVVETPHDCKGFVDVFDEEDVTGTSVQISDRKIIILGPTLPAAVTPEPGDKLTAEGATFTIVKDGVVRDPAGATFACTCR